MAEGELAPVPGLQGLVLFEVYEASGALLVVTSDALAARDYANDPTDVVVRRPWATAAEPVVVTSRPPKAAGPP